MNLHDLHIYMVIGWMIQNIIKLVNFFGHKTYLGVFPTNVYCTKTLLIEQNCSSVNMHQMQREGPYLIKILILKQ